MIEEIWGRDAIVEPETALREDKEIAEWPFTDERVDIRYMHLEYKCVNTSCPH